MKDAIESAPEVKTVHRNIMCLVHPEHIAEEDIGTYVKYPLNDLAKYFPEGRMFGEYSTAVVPFTRKFALMITEEAAKIMYMLKFI